MNKFTEQEREWRFNKIKRILSNEESYKDLMNDLSYSEREIDDYFFIKLGLCGCGNPDLVKDALLKIMKYFKERTDLDTPSVHPQEFAQRTEDIENRFMGHVKNLSSAYTSLK